MASWHNASFLRKSTDVLFRGIRLGSINDVGHNISDEEALWLLSSAERHGVSVAEFIAAIVKDVYAEENESVAEFIAAIVKDVYAEENDDGN